MSSVDEVRQAIAQAQQASERATHDRVRAAGAVRAAEVGVQAARRAGDETALARAQRELERAQRRSSTAQDARREAREALAAGLELAVDVVDPRELIAGLSADIPFLLFPVRLETRFMHVVDPDSGVRREQLWVRVFPDTVSVDAFGEELSDSEVSDAQAFWTEVWAAAGNEDGERAAWHRLVHSHGSGRGAWMVSVVRPTNEEERPQGPTDPAADPVFPDVETTSATWHRAPRAALLPDRFVFVTESGDERTEWLGRPVPPEVFTGPDPLAPAEEAVSAADGRLALPDELAWLTDFDRAVHDGLGIRIDLQPGQSTAGFDRLYVVGVRVLDGPHTSADRLQTLLRHHRFSGAGLSFVPQGTATNNTEASDSGHSAIDDPDTSFDAMRLGAVPLEPDPLLRRDGQWFADLLGIDPDTLVGVPGAHGLDQRDARAMQALLWPATMGYLLGTQLEPVISDPTVEQARWFFTHHVRGRGSLPAFRVGRQPYGITTTTAFSRITWLRPRPQLDLSPRPAFLTRLHALLTLADEDWDDLVATVPSLGRGGAAGLDAHQTLLGILGLHPASAEFHYRYAESIDQIANTAGLGGWSADFWESWVKAGLDRPALELLQRLGYDGDERPPLLDLYFHGRQAPLKGPLVDDRPLSETEAVRVWATGERNYLQWLLDAAQTSLDAVRTTSGFVDAVPTTLLFLLARHALILGYAESSWRLHDHVGYDAATVRALRREPAFVHVDPGSASESRYAPLYRHDPRISPGQDWSVAAQISHVLHTHPSTRVLREQVEALELLVDASTARLERAMVEHLDTVTYRLDAWRLGLVNAQLELMRGIPQDDVETAEHTEPGDDGPRGEAGEPGEDGEPERPETPRRGIHLGAYGWLEDVRRNRTDPVPVELPDDLAAAFAEGTALQRDPDSGGHLLAPSLNQAVTASVLRSGYLASASPADPQAMTVNLSSERVRKAMDVLAGMRQGQSLAELLGYAFERGLHDASGFAEVDEFIYDLRLRFPLRSNRLDSTAQTEGVSIEAIEARNVLDGLRLVEHVEQNQAFSYPFGLPASVLRADASAAQRAAIEREVAALRDLRDAVGDLALAESVHQATQGSADRAGAALRTVETGHRPPEIEVVRTPATGVTLTHRVGIHLDPAASAGVGATPRALAEPAVDAYCAALLPPLDTVACRVHWKDPVDGSDEFTAVTLADLGLRARDVVELLRSGEQAMDELDDRVVRHVLTTPGGSPPTTPRPDARLEIAYREADPGQVPVFDIAAQCDHLRSIVTTARALRPTDVVLAGEAAADLDAVAVVDPARLLAVHSLLGDLLTDVTAYLDGWEPRLADLATHRDAVLDDADTAVDDAVALLERGARLAVPGSGWGQAIASRAGQYARTMDRVRELLARWDARLVGIDAALQDYADLPAGTPDEERFAALAAIEGAIVPAQAGGLAEPEATPVLQLAAVQARRDAFAGRADGLRALLATTAPGLVSLRTELLGHLPVSDVDPTPFEVASTEAAMIALVHDVVAGVRSLAEVLSARDAAATTAFADHAAATDPPAALTALEAAAEALLGEGFLIVPRFTVPTAAAAEWAQALGDQAGLLAHLVATARDFPVEDWVHSAARVREPLRRLEQAGLLARALVQVDPELTPIQLPYRPGDAWLAMEFPPGQDLTGEHLLYTAQYPAGFDPTGDVCGLLVDAWTEVLPSDETTVGLAFHYDQPSSEAPQSLLLVTPASGGKTWTWDDLRQAVPDTMRLARQRAVEPGQLDADAVARFLPATITALTTHGISIGLSYAVSNLVHVTLEDGDG
ncbi:hypothetical protein [Intrasporangium sp.]|uniref:hypothetical protein n=1 Tax=Intrasporangium sp. TaxID=1925024 RepID=UPI00293AA8BC|nr:hypothetical protein [Intrasporangium sp.]MDV3220319.1 hypothetical protein [Intrasporangium sp.]